MQRILDNWLKDEAWYERSLEVARHIDDRGHDVGESSLLDFQVAIHECNLIAEWNLGRNGIHDIPEQISIGDDRAKGRIVRAVANQHGNAIERAEQEVRVKLRRECLEARLCKLSLEARGVDLPITSMLDQIERRDDCCDGHVRGHLE